MGCGQSNEKVHVVVNSRHGGQNLDTSFHHSQIKGYNTRDQHLVEDARALVYSCMDFRLLDDIVIFMNEIGYHNNYDQFILAGCSLSFVVRQFKQWRKIARDHLDLAVKMHSIKEIMCIEHEKCGAYKLCYPEMKLIEEKNLHTENLAKFKKKMERTHPELLFHGYYMHIDGHCERVI